MANDIKIIVQYETVTRAKKEVKQLASTTVSLDKAQKSSSNTTNKLANETHKLALKYKPLYASSKLYERNLNEINRANKLGVISDKQRQISLDRLNNEFATGTGVFSSYANGMTKGANRMGVAMQQTGYQVGDFLVQVQAGTNPMVAFGQQATQLVGVMYLLPQATLAAKVGIMGLKISMGALAMSLGILIPLATAIGAAFLRTRKEADKASKGIKTYEERLKSAKDAVKNLVEELEKLKGGFVDLHELTLSQELSQQSAKLVVLEQEKLNLAQRGNKAYNAQLAAINKKITSQEESVKLAKEELNTYKDLVKEKANFLVRSKNMQDLISSRSIGSASKNPFSAIYQGALELSNKTYKNEEKLIALRKDNMDSLSKSASVIPSAFSTGFKGAMEGVSEVAEARTKRLAILFEGMQGRRGAISPSKTDVALMGMGPIVTDLGKAEALQRKNQLEAIKHFYEEKAKTEAQDLAMAIKIAEIKESLRQKEYAGMQGRRGARGPSAIEIAEMGMGPQITDAQSKLEAQEKLNKKQEEYLATLSLTTQEQLVTQGLKDRELLVAEQFNEKYKVQLELEELGLKQGSARYDRALELLNTQQESVLIAYDQLEAEKKLTEEKEKQGQLIDTIGGIIGDGFISMVEGTESVKDAFKSMARAIIKELYEILVVQQMVNAAKAAMGIPFADGGVFSGGSQVQAYADGGIVGGPTTFPMSGGRTGLMGEAGPEAIMPLKRGANGKLGVQMEGGGATTVVQNFNFSANGDDSVKRIIAQAAPKIAQMTKSEIINDRRRGGTMKATFG